MIVDAAACDALAPPAPGETRYELADLIVMRRVADGDLPPAAAAMLELYLPYCMAPVHARRMRRAFAVSHFAQSLDGRIATCDGDARWIGCDENHVHAHRMRALCDGILIGCPHTPVTDRPALTVRHADGVGSRFASSWAAAGAGDVGCLERAGSSPIVLIDDRRARVSGRRGTSCCPRRTAGIATSEVLEALYRTISCRSTSKAAPPRPRRSSPRATSTSCNCTSHR